MPEIDESLAGGLVAKRLGCGVLVQLECPIFFDGMHGSRGVHDKRALSCDVVKHDLNNTSLVKNNLIIIIIYSDDHFHSNINYFYTI